MQNTSSSVRQRARAALNLGHQVLLRQIGAELQGCESVLDVGCGRSSILEELPRLARSVGVDGYAAAVEESRERGVHDEYIVGDVMELDLPDGSFDAVLMMDLLEHLEPVAGAALLDRMARVAAKKVVVFTPNGFIEQGEYDDNPLQIHRSGWTAEDFRRRGYRVVGCKGWSVLRGVESTPRKPAVLTRPLSSMTQPLVQRVPRLAYALLAIRDVEGGRTADA